MMQKDKLKITTLTKNYIPQLVQLEKLYFGQPWSYQNFIDNINNKFSINFVCLYNDCIIGYINGQLIFEQGYIHKILVCKQFQNKNIGFFILNHFINYLSQKKCQVVDLEVRKSNINAIRLYEKFNFKNIGIRKKFYQNPCEDAILMQKKI